jgi:thiol-disulfide isomerase/thioredoxin
MKIKLFSCFLAIMLVLLVNTAISQDQKKLPSTKVKNLNGEIIDTKTFNNDGKPFVISFWATWCKPCIVELSTMADVYEQWQKETGVKIICVSIDDSRSTKKVAPFVNSRGWGFEVYLDENSDFRRMMNAVNPPHSFLCNGKGEIVWQHSGFAPGDEDELYKEIKKLTVDSEKKN